MSPFAQNFFALFTYSFGARADWTSLRIKSFPSSKAVKPPLSVFSRAGQYLRIFCLSNYFLDARRRAIAVSPPSLERPLRSIQEIMDASTVSRQNGVDLEILFEGAI